MTALPLAHRLRARLIGGILPGFGLSLGITVAWLGLLVLLPLAALVIHAGDLGWAGWWRSLATPRVADAFAVTFGVSLVAALINLVGGLLAAWVLVRYRFPGRRLLDALVDLPFALPTAVAGISLTALFSSKGWLGPFLTGYGIQVNNTTLGIGVALTFVSLPFVVRTVQPVLEELPREVEEAASSLGAGRWQILRRIIIPQLIPAALTGFALAFARAVGEYGSVIFISGGIPRRTEIVPHLILIRLEDYDYAGATALGSAMLLASFLLLLLINLLQRWTARRNGGAP